MGNQSVRWKSKIRRNVNLNRIKLKAYGFEKGNRLVVHWAMNSKLEPKSVAHRAEKRVDDYGCIPTWVVNAGNLSDYSN